MPITKGSVTVRVSNNVEPTDNRGIKAPSLQARASSVDCCGTARTSRINVEAGASEFEEIVDTPTSKRPLASRDSVYANVLTSIKLSPIIADLSIVCSYPSQISRGGAVWCIPGHLERFVCCNERQAVHRISFCSLSG